MNLQTERMSNAGQPRPEQGKGFGSLLQQGFYINYLHGLDYLCRKYINKNSRILELGCFYGASAELFREYSDFVTCVDIVLYPEMEHIIKTKNVNFIQSDSIEYLNVTKEQYDLIYVDTTHDFSRTKDEIRLSYDHIYDTGYIAGHDYNVDGVWNAILDTFEYPDIEIYLDSSWIIQKNNNLKLKYHE